jgi:hypothetical protein
MLGMNLFKEKITLPWILYFLQGKNIQGWNLKQYDSERTHFHLTGLYRAHLSEMWEKSAVCFGNVSIRSDLSFILSFPREFPYGRSSFPYFAHWIQSAYDATLKYFPPNGQ